MDEMSERDVSGNDGAESKGNLVRKKESLMNNINGS